MNTTDLRIDSKGKYYTKLVSTQQLRVRLRLLSGELVEGDIHIRPERRLSDELNESATATLSFTNACVMLPDGGSFDSAYLAVPRHALSWVVPMEAIGQDEAHLDE